MSDEEPVTLEVDDGYHDAVSFLPGEPTTVTLDIQDAVSTTSSPTPSDEDQEEADGGDR